MLSSSNDFTDSRVVVLYPGNFPMRGTYFLQNEYFEVGDGEAFCASDLLDWDAPRTILVGTSIKGIFNSQVRQ